MELASVRTAPCPAAAITVSCRSCARAAQVYQRVQEGRGLDAVLDAREDAEMERVREKAAAEKRELQMLGAKMRNLRAEQKKARAEAVKKEIEVQAERTRLALRRRRKQAAEAVREATNEWSEERSRQWGEFRKKAEASIADVAKTRSTIKERTGKLLMERRADYQAEKEHEAMAEEMKQEVIRRNQEAAREIYNHRYAFLRRGQTRTRTLALTLRTLIRRGL